MTSPTTNLAATMIQESPDHFNGCGCPLCTNRIERVLSEAETLGVAGEDASVDNRAGTVAANGKTIWSADQIAAYLNRSGASWTQGTNAGLQSDDNPNEITFGFYRTVDDLANNGYVYTTDGTNSFGLAEYFQFGTFNAA